jgi:arylsulfatase A-like enzyme
MHVQNIHESYDPPPPYNSQFQKVSGLQKVKGFAGDFDIRCANDILDTWRSGIFPPHLKDEVIALYDGEIRLVDDQLKSIFETLKSAEVYDDTLIVILSDHGEILFEKYDHNFLKQGPGHTSCYTDAAIRVPLIAKPAGASKGSSTSRPSSLVSTINLAPTLLEMMNIEAESGMSGVSLVPLMSPTGSPQPDQKIFIHDFPYETEYLGVRTKNWKLVIENADEVENILLIDIQNDPDENRNVYSEYLQKGDELKNMLQSWKHKTLSANRNTTRGLSDKMRRALIDGGYIQ